MTKILVLDQATSTGVSVFETNEEGFELLWHCCIKVKGNSMVEKMFSLCDHIEEIIKEEKIDLIILEDVQKQVNQKTFGDLNKLMGGLLEVAHKHCVFYEVVHSSTWRKGLGIKGKKREELKSASKQYVLDRYGIDVSDDVADSICIGTYYLLNN